MHRVRLRTGFYAKKLGRLIKPLFGQSDGAIFNIDFKIVAFAELRRHIVGLLIKSLAPLGRAGNNQRRTRFIDQDRVDFVNNRKVTIAAHLLFQALFQIIAQIIEAKF